jgi:hypothetical protein
VVHNFSQQHDLAEFECKDLYANISLYFQNLTAEEYIEHHKGNYVYTAILCPRHVGYGAFAQTELAHNDLSTRLRIGLRVKRHLITFS